MEGQCHLKYSVKLPSSHKTDSKKFGEKRRNTEFRERHDYAYKRTKMRDLESVCRSEEINRDHSKDLKKNEDQNYFHHSNVEISQVAEGSIHLGLDVSLAEKSGENTALNRLPDLKSEVCRPKNSTSIDLECADNSDRSFPGEKHVHCVSSTGVGLNLNADDVSSIAGLGANCSSTKNHDDSKSRDMSECESSTGPLEEKDPLRQWKEFKHNGFLSSNHGGIPMPRPRRGRKSKNDALKRQMELAKKEQVDRFVKIAEPTGLLNRLNPGIINHVRNRKQVHSIIQALVKPEKLEKKQNNANCSEAPELSNHGYEPANSYSESMQTKDYIMPMARSSLISDGQGGDSEQIVLERRTCSEKCASLLNSEREEDELALKLSLSSKASMYSSSVSREGSGSFSCVSSLSLEAADVASQWLKLLHQDIKGRLSALRRSKKRVQAVITVELPFLIAKELPETQDNGSFDSSDGFSESARANLHQARWTKLFDQMNKALSEEERELESWLNNVQAMQMHCGQGLEDAQLGAAHGYQIVGGPENSSRSERGLAVGAAAASIYSTCNFLMDNLSYFCSNPSPFLI